jgi:hypothetical protein
MSAETHNKLGSQTCCAADHRRGISVLKVPGKQLGFCSPGWGPRKTNASEPLLADPKRLLELGLVTDKSRPERRLTTPGACYLGSPGPRAEKGPAISASGRTVIAGAVIRAIKCAIPIDPTRDGAPALQAIAHPSFLADDPGMFHQKRRR